MRTPFQGKGTTMQRVDEESAERRKGKKRRKRMIEVSGIQKEKRERKRERGRVEYRRNNVARSRARSDLTNQESILLFES